MTNLKETLAAKAAATTLAKGDSEKEIGKVEKEYKKEEASKLTKAYVATNGSRRGYQFGNRIIRPDMFGVYVATSENEAKFLSQLAEQNILQPLVKE
jgi:hypothetical protein